MTENEKTKLAAARRELLLAKEELEQVGIERGKMKILSAIMFIDMIYTIQPSEPKSSKSVR